MRPENCIKAYIRWYSIRIVDISVHVPCYREGNLLMDREISSLLRDTKHYFRCIKGCII